MNERLKERLKPDESKHKTYLFWHRFGEHVGNYGQRGFWPFGDGKILTIIRMALHLPVLLIFLGLFVDNILYGVIANFVFNGILWGVGRFLENSFAQKLVRLQQKCTEDHREFYLQQCERNDLVAGYDGAERTYPNQINISGVWAKGPTKSACQVINLYPMNNSTESGRYYEVHYNLGTNYCEMTKNIASVVFNERYRIITLKQEERECMKFFSPTVLLGLTKAKVFDNLKEVSIRNGQFSARTDYYAIPFPEQIDLFSWRPLHRYYEEVMNYCRKTSENIDMIYEDLIVTKMFLDV